MVCFDGNGEDVEDQVGGMLFSNVLVEFEIVFLCNKMLDENGVRCVVGGGFIRRFPFTSLIFV